MSPNYNRITQNATHSQNLKRQQEEIIYGEWESIVGIDDVSETLGIGEGVRLSDKQQAAFKLENQKFLKR